MDAISLGQVLVFVSVLGLAILTPGPAIVACARSAAARGLAVALPYSLGLAVGAAFWCLAALFGLTVLFELFPGLFLAAKLVGGVYLVYVGWQIWSHARDPLGEGAALAQGPGFTQGIILNLSNPKPALFYAAVLLRVFPGLHGVAAPLAVFAIALTVELTFYLGVTALMSKGPVRRRYFAAKPLIDRVSGGLIAALGLSLILRP